VKCKKLTDAILFIAFNVFLSKVNAWSADRLDHAIELTITLVEIRRGGFIFTDNFKLLSKNITVDHGGISHLNLLR